MKKMKTTKTILAGGLLFLMLTVISSCNRVPITGRKQFNLLPESELTAMSLVEYNNFLSTNQVVNSGTNAAMVTRVGNKIAKSVEDVLRNSGNGDLLEYFDWEFHLVESPEPNAWCMPGGKVVVYTGILPFTKDEDGLAVVMGHEIAHAIARHGNERMSQQLLASTGFAALDIAMANKPEQTRELILLAAGVGVNTGALLPFSRLQVLFSWPLQVITLMQRLPSGSECLPTTAVFLNFSVLTPATIRESPIWKTSIFRKHGNM